MSKDGLKKALIELKQNISKIDKKNYLFIIPVAILILISSFQIAYFHFESSITNKIIDSMNGKNVTDETISLIKEFINTYDNQFLSLGLEIIGIAISVWIGLNIYNIVKRDSIKELEIVAKETQKELKEFSDNYKQFNITAIQNAYIKEDRINLYYLKEFTENYPNILDYKLTKYIVFFEKSLEKIIDYYNSNDTKQMKNHLDKLKLEIDSLREYLREKHIKLDKESQNIMNSYIDCRLGDYNYYYGLYHKSRNEKESEIDYLIKAQNKYELILEKYKINDKIVQTYINNVNGYIFQLLQQVCDKSLKNDYIVNAYNYSKKACIDKRGQLINTNYERDHRNFGVNIENYLKINNPSNEKYIDGLVSAYEQYKTAYKINSQDIKSLICLSSVILKIFDRIIGLHDDSIDFNSIAQYDKNKFDEKYNSFISKYSSYELLEEAYQYMIKAKLIDNTNVAIHYHLIHIYMYKYIFTNKNITIKENGEKEIKYCLALCFNQKLPKAFLYKTRNFYYAIDDKENAEKYKEKIKNDR